MLFAFPFDGDIPAVCKLKPIVELFANVARAGDFTALAVGLHAARHVDRVSPDVEEQPIRSDNAGIHGSRVDTDSVADRQLLGFDDLLLKRLARRHREARDGFSGVSYGIRDAAHGHEAVADGFDLFHAMGDALIFQHPENFFE